MVHRLGRAAAAAVPGGGEPLPSDDHLHPSTRGDTLAPIAVEV